MVSRVSHEAKSGMWGEVEITEGNLNAKNKHFYMRSFLERFPADLIGGSNAAKAAPRNALIDWGGASLVETDIDGEDKKFFRKRGWVRELYEREKAEPGDWVRVEETAPYRYRVTIIKKACR